MNKTYERQKNALIAFILSTLFLFISGVAYYIYDTQKKQLILSEQERVETEARLIGRFLVNSIIRRDYAESKNFLRKWMENRDDVAELEVLLPNGKKLFFHQDDFSEKDLVVYSESLPIGQTQLHIELAHDISKAKKSITRLGYLLMAFTVILTMVFGAMLWGVLSRWILYPLRDEIERRTDDARRYSSYVDSVINSISSHIAIIDEKGIIHRTNKAWQEFAKKNGYSDDPSMVGESYFHVCEVNSLQTCHNPVEEGILQVLNRKADEYIGDYGCHSPDAFRWFSVKASMVEWPGSPRMVILHDDITHIKKIQFELEKKTDQLQQINRSYQALSESNIALLKADKEQELLDEVCRIIGSDCRYNLVWIGYAEHDEKKGVRAMSSFGENLEFLNSLDVCWSDDERGQGAVGRSIKERKAVIINDVKNNSCFDPWREKANEKGYGSCAAFPVWIYGEMIGSVVVCAKESDAFLIEEVRLLTELARNLAFGITALRGRNRIKELSITDQLTGLYNRHQINETLESEIERSGRYAHPLSLMLMDIDWFKDVNDTHGHQVGDQILQEFANILERERRSMDVTGRWGGEEFIVILPGTSLDSATQVAERMRKVIEKHTFPVVERKTASFGVATFHENDTMDHLIERADDALYRAKNAGRNRVEKEECFTS